MYTFVLIGPWDFLWFWFLRLSLENCSRGAHLGVGASSDKENCYPTGWNVFRHRLLANMLTV